MLSNKKKKAIAKGEVKPKSRKAVKITLIVTFSILAVLILLLAVGYFLVDRYIDSTLDYISYVSDGEEEWSGVDIDSPDYKDDYDMNIDYSDFVDPEAGRDESHPIYPPETSTDDPAQGGNGGGSSGGGSSGGGGGGYVRPPEPPYKPDYEILEGLFDGDTVTEAYDKDVINILLIGADTVSGNYARSDTMILMSINNVKKRIVFTSFMRDTYVSIPGYRDNRLNASFAAGGPSLLIKTIKLNFDIDIDHYFLVSFSAFEQAVNIIGGIDVTVNDVNYNYFNRYSQLSGLTKEQAIDGTHVIHLTGYEALLYARNRKYTDGDFTRTLHQRDFLIQFVQNCRGKSLSQLHELLKAVLPYVKTNMPKDKLKSMVWDITTYISYTITDARVPCAGSFNFANVRGMEVLIVNFPANQKYVKAKIYG